MSFFCTSYLPRATDQAADQATNQAINQAINRAADPKIESLAQAASANASSSISPIPNQNAFIQLMKLECVKASLAKLHTPTSGRKQIAAKQMSQHSKAASLLRLAQPRSLNKEDSKK
jgi:hypothetical protein